MSISTQSGVHNGRRLWKRPVIPDELLCAFRMPAAVQRPLATAGIEKGSLLPGPRLTRDPPLHL